LVKENKGRKITLPVADRQFASFPDRIHEVNSNHDFGIEVPLAILFGSYMRREAKVGDI
jgi:hypothetical protein